MGIEIEKIADNRYRLRAHGHILTVSAQDLLDLVEHLRQGARLYNLETEARAAVAREGVEKPWLPAQPGEEF